MADAQGEYIIFAEDLTATEDLAANIFVGVDGKKAGAGKSAYGVSRYAAKSGQDASLLTSGIAVVKTGAAVTKGALVVSDASGYAVPASALTVAAGAVPVVSSAANGAILAGSVTPEVILGKALDADAVGGATIRVKFF